MIDILLFNFLSSLAFVSTIMVITLSNAVHSVLFLIIVFCSISSLLLILGTEFFSFMFLIVYVGAIAVLFLFVVMMLNIKTNPIKVNIWALLPIGLIIFIVLITQIISLMDNQFILFKQSSVAYTTWINENNYLTNVEVIGNFLYTKFCFLFLICGLVLLVAMVGAIVLTMHQRPKVKKQQISTQLLRNPRGSIKFVYLRN